MSEWYYASADGQRHGPLPAAQLHALAVAGAIGPQTLVWRAGMAQWQPLQVVQAGAGLESVPPPLPGTPVTSGVPGAPAAPAPRPGMSGCMIATLLGLCLVVVVPILGILAAIALPAYADYTARAQAAAAILQVTTQQPAVAAFAGVHGRCPRNGDAGFDQPGDYAGASLSSIAFDQAEDHDLCLIEGTITAPGKPALDGQYIWLELDRASGRWTCSSSVADKHLPATCRG